MTAMMKTPDMKNVEHLRQAEEKDVVKVFCRIRSPQDENYTSCLRILSDKEVSLISHNAASSRAGPKELHCTFRQVFKGDDSQQTVFKQVALPLIKNLFSGRNGLLFAYGITGSGKTYTMTGDSQDSGIIPRSLDVIFNNITHLQADKYIFKPDKMNGFEIQSDRDASKDRHRELQTYLKSARSQKTPKKKDDIDEFKNIPEYIQLEDVDEDNSYAVFVSYIEIYKNTVYDLLDSNINDAGRSRNLQAKIVREDSAHNMYVHGVVEVEVKSSKEACEVLYSGMRRKRVAVTLLNSGSSRGHAVFTIRLVQAPLDRYGEFPIHDKQIIHVSQLCLVDLAGSERSNRTKNCGQRLMESGNINNSLMTLKSCLEILRENQLQGTKKLVPYRDSKLTYLLKNYFEGKSQIHALICVNPTADDFDETIHVMKFADVTKEVQVTQQVDSAKHNLNFPVGRRKDNQMHVEEFRKANQHIQERSTDEECSVDAAFPSLEMKEPGNNNLIPDLLNFLELRKTQYQSVKNNSESKEKEFSDRLKLLIEENILLLQESANLKDTYYHEKKKRINLELKLCRVDSRIQELQQTIKDQNEDIKATEQKLAEINMQINQQQLDTKVLTQKYKKKFLAEVEKGEREMKYMLHKQEAELKELAKETLKPLSKLKRILNNGSAFSSTSSSDSDLYQHGQGTVIRSISPISPRALSTVLKQSSSSSEELLKAETHRSPAQQQSLKSPKLLPQRGSTTNAVA
ncbi:kinesin-like protein KIF23 isoform X2 [Periplaneta americana]|uniref:kinesin-like protein KIF23 isoform X2 n=1 Tax=Periplaneta americana TaxID=6978 RepID=UPI0037E94475